MKFRHWYFGLCVLFCFCFAPFTQAQTAKHDAAWYQKQGYVKNKKGTWFKPAKHNAAWYRKRGYARTKTGTWHKRDASWYQKNGYTRTKSGTWYKKKS